MATAVSQMQPVLTTPILIALVTLKGYEESSKRELYISDLAGYLIELKRGGVDVGRIALSGLPGKYWSEDVAQFISEGIVYGYIRHRSPLEFTKDCVEVCMNAIRDRVQENDALKSQLCRAREILNLETLSAI